MRNNGTVFLVGIDPGKHGAISCIEKSNSKFHLIDLFSIPVDTTTKNVKSRRTGKTKRIIKTEYNVNGLVYIFNHIKEMVKSSGNIVCRIERVHAMPRDGGQGAFNFGYGYGLIKGIAAALGFNVEDITIPRWKSKFNIKNKTDSISVAYSLVDGIEECLKRNKKKKLTNDEADAILIGLTSPN